MKSPEILREVSENLKKASEKLEKVGVLEENKKRKAIKLLTEASQNFLKLSSEVEVDNVQMAEFSGRDLSR